VNAKSSPTASKTLEREAHPSLAEVLPEQILPKLENLPPEGREVIEEIYEATLAVSGPIPPPSLAAGYEKLLPGATDRLFKMAELQITSISKRMDADVDAETDSRSKNQTYRLCGLLAGALVSLSLIAAGCLVAIYGQAPVAGSLVSLLGVGTGLAGIFVKGRPLTDSETAEPKPKEVPRADRHSETKTQRARAHRKR
jgi:uncharacterized membrane protein